MKSKRIFYYDILNISACIGVIALHHNRCVHKFTPSSDWDAALIIEVLFFWAVPIFFMLTGATLMEYRKRYDTKTFFKRRISRNTKMTTCYSSGFFGIILKISLNIFWSGISDYF